MRRTLLFLTWAALLGATASSSEPNPDSSGSLRRASTSAATTSASGDIGIHLLGLGQHDLDRISRFDLDYLQRKGVTLVRLDLSWEKLQPDLSEGLDDIQVSSLRDALDALWARGIRVVLDMHQYGRYNPNWRQTLPPWASYPGISIYSYAAYNPWVAADRTDGVIGSEAVPLASFGKFWHAIAKAFGGHPAVWGYDLVNEPVRMGGIRMWQAAAQEAIDAIRKADTTTRIILEPYYGGDSPGDWPKLAFPDVSDPARRIVLSPHVYFDQNSSGYYRRPYHDDAAYPTLGVDRVTPAIRMARDRGMELFYGEFGTPPTDNALWGELVQNTLAYFKQHGVAATWCQYAIRLPDLDKKNLPPGAAGWWYIQNNQNNNPIFGIFIQPDDQGVERPQMAWLERYLGRRNPQERLVLGLIEAQNGRIAVPPTEQQPGASHVVVAGDGRLTVDLPFGHDQARREDLSDRIQLRAFSDGQLVELFNVPTIRFKDGTTEQTGLVKGVCAWPIAKPVTADAKLCNTGELRRLRHVIGGDQKPYWNWECQGRAGGLPMACGTSG